MENLWKNEDLHQKPRIRLRKKSRTLSGKKKSSNSEDNQTFSGMVSEHGI